MKVPFLVFIFFILQSAVSVAARSGLRTISLKQGNVTGTVVRPRHDSTYLREVETYLGIPYAAPPLKKLRFMPPGAPLPWTGTLYADTMRPVCVQTLPNQDDKIVPERNIFVRRMKKYLKTESEDCLYMNLYVPRVNGNEKRTKMYPVIMFVHGESFEWNSGNLYDGSIIASYGEVIFVTVNFRLGIFGFLKQSLSEGRSNFGLSDQIAALQWIKGNIAEFGGDAGQVTVMGHGTGAASVNFLMLSPVAEGLFHRAILMGGSALSEWALSTAPLHHFQLADDLGCSKEDIINCLQEKNKDDIIAASKKIDRTPFKSAFTPVVDEVVVLNSPADHMEKYSLFSKYDLLAGVNEVESYYLLEDSFLKFGMLISEANSVLETYAKSVYKKTPDAARNKIAEKYLSHLKSNAVLQTRTAVLDALSDMLVTAPLLQTVRYHVKHKSTYLYVFGQRTASENFVKINKSVTGDDLPYALGVPLSTPTFHYQSSYTQQEECLSKAMMRYFTNFAKTGNPNIPNSHDVHACGSVIDHKLDTFWPPYDSNTQLYLYFKIPVYMRQQYRLEWDKFWNSVLVESLKSAPNPISDVENDGVNVPTYEFPPFTHPSDFYTNQYNNFYKPIATNTTEVIESSSTTLVILTSIGIIFLLCNVIACSLIYYQRGKLRMREQLFKNRFRCKTVSVPDIFEETDSGNLYSLAENDEKQTAGDSKVANDSKTNDYDVIKVQETLASIKPEAMAGKRMRRWPLSRPSSGSTITMDPHTKVRHWIAQEIVNKYSPAFIKRTPRNKKRPGNVQSDNTKKALKPKAQKVSIAIDATPAARTGSVLKQIPIELTKSLDDGKSALCGKMKSSASVACISKPTLQGTFGFSSEESDDYYNRTGTHKSSAHIRLKTPDFLLDGGLSICHSHSKSDPSPMTFDFKPEPIYSQVNKEKKLKSFSSSKGTSTENSVESASHYEDINVTSIQDVTQLESYGEDMLGNIKRRNYPKVLPDLPDKSKRLSLPGLDAKFSKFRTPPAPPPRVSTLGRKRYSPPTIARDFIPEERCADVIQMETVAPSESDSSEPCVIIKPAAVRKPMKSQIPRVQHPGCASPKPVKAMRSVTTSTTGIPVARLKHKN